MSSILGICVLSSYGKTDRINLSLFCSFPPPKILRAWPARELETLHPGIRNSIPVTYWSYPLHDALKFTALVEAAGLNWFCWRDQADAAVGTGNRLMKIHQSKNVHVVGYLKGESFCLIVCCNNRNADGTDKRPSGRFEQIRLEV